jgi:alcohol dehydrogenase
MRGMVFDGSLKLRDNLPTPAPARGEALLRLRQAGVCSTDLEICRGYMAFNGILGHEFVADVVRCDVDPSWIGKRVAGEINAVCGECDRCTSGLKNHCTRRTVLGIAGRDGAFADHFTLPAINLHELPESVDDDRGVFVEPLAAALAIVNDVPVADGTYVTVIGDGRLGLLCAQVLRNAGAPVRLLGKHDDKLALAGRWEIKSRRVTDITPRHDQDVVVDCTGSPGGLKLALQLVRPRGTIVLKSTYAGEPPLNLASAVIDEVRIVGSRCGVFQPAIAALANNTVDVVSLIHRRFRLDQGVEALDVAGRPGVLKVLIRA